MGRLKSACTAMLASIGVFAASGAAADTPEFTPTGQFITPRAAPGAIFQQLNPHLAVAPDWTAQDASAVALSPNGKTLLILTSGFNLYRGADGKDVADMSSEWVFVFDVSGAKPVQKQAIPVPNTFLGVAWAPSSEAFYVSGGVDDVVYEYGLGLTDFTKTRTFKLGHTEGVGLAVKPEAGPLALSTDGHTLAVANVQNDSVSLIDRATGVIREQDLRPGVIDPAKVGTPGGSFPRAVIWTSPTRLYVASERDREVIALDVGPGAIKVVGRIRTDGQPVAFAARGGRIFVALDNADRVAVIDTRSNRIVDEMRAALAPGVPPAMAKLGGAGVNGVEISGDGRFLYATNGGANDVAVIGLASKPHASRVVGLIPTGWYPTALAVQPNGRQLYVVNGKSNTGPNPGNCRVNLGIDPHHNDACRATNTYVWQLEKAGFLTLKPPAPAPLAKLTARVAANNRYAARSHAGEGEATMAFLRQHIRHVIYIVKENRTYDQVLGDLEVGNGDPKLTVFGRAITPNQHTIARQFVDLDAFYDSGESSNTGWDWTTAARTNDWSERESPVNYANRGLQFEQEGANRNMNVGYATNTERRSINPLNTTDENVLPGARDIAAPDGPDGKEGRGYIWDAALRAGLSLRNYGFFGDLSLYRPSAGHYRIPLDHDPAAKGLKVFYVDKPALMGVTDPYYYGFNQAFPDFWREREWEREYDQAIAKGDAPNLTLLRLAHDHTGSFDEAIDGVNTVEAELADNDYAVGLVVQKVAQSRFAKDTLIFVIEDDAQDGPDHVDAHRSIAFVVGPYVKHGAVVSERYTTVNMVKTIEAVLGLKPIGINDAMAAPMSQVFDTRQADWSFTPQVPSVLRASQLPLPPATSAEARCPAPPMRSSAYWAAAMRGQDFAEEDRLDTARFNRALWRGLKGAAPYPVGRDGKDLRRGRPALLAAAGVAGCG